MKICNTYGGWIGGRLLLTEQISNGDTYSSLQQRWILLPSPHPTERHSNSNVFSIGLVHNSVKFALSARIIVSAIAPHTAHMHRGRLDIVAAALLV